MSEWIDIKNTAPNQYDDVLVYDDSSHIYIATLYIDGDRHFINDCCDGTLVTHWKLLPEPPK